MKTEAAQVAALCKSRLKAMGIKAKVSSKNYSGGNSVRVYLINQSPETLKKIDSMFSCYEYGSFDGMTDSYNYTNVIDEIPQVKFLFVECEYTDELKQAAYTKLRAEYSAFENCPESYKEAQNMRIDLGMCHYVSTALHQYLSSSNYFSYAKLDAAFFEQFGGVSLELKLVERKAA